MINIREKYLRGIESIFTILILLVLLANPTYASSNWGASKYVAVVDDYNSPNMGNIYPADYPNQTFSILSPTKLSNTSLANYDTLFLWAFNPGLLNSTQKTAINSWVYMGGKLIIWDSEEPYYSPGRSWDYTWLPYPFSTSVPGAQGAYGRGFQIVEENTLSSNITSSAYYINTAIINSQTDAVGDANIFTSYGSNWCVDMRAKNVLNVEGPVHLYGRYGNGLIIYSGLDWDDASYSGWPANWATASGGRWLKKIFKQELDVSGGLPCGVIQPGTPSLQVTITSDRPSYNIGDSITFNIAVTNTGNATANSVNLTNIAPPEITITGNSSFSLGNMAAGASLSRTITATANTNGTVINIATAVGRDSQSNIIAGTGNATFTVIGPSVTPTAGPLSNIVVHPNTANLYIGDSQQFNATGTDANGNIVPITPIWASSNTAAGTINPAGLFSAISAGTVTVTASSGGITGSATVNVSSLSALEITANQIKIIENTPTYVTFTVTSNSRPISNALVSVTGAATGSGSTDIDGKVTILINAAMGTITATASKAGYNSATMTLTVVTAPMLVISANQSNVIVNTPTYVTFTVAANSTGGAPVSGAFVSLTGAATGSGTTDINGRVTILINAAFGTITATASKTSYISGTLTLTAINQPTLTISASPDSVVVNNPTYVLYTVTENGIPVSGALVSLTGAATGSGTTNRFGNVNILVNAGMGTITSTASKTGYTSGTLTTTVTSAMTLTVTANPSAVVVNTPTYVTFNVTDSGQPVSGALLSLAGGATGSGTTDTNGQVTILINAGLGTITATASKTGYTSGTATLTTSNSPILTIAANPGSVVVSEPTYITFTVTNGGQPVSGAIVSLTGAATGSSLTDTNGNATILVISGLGTITVTASKTNYDSGTLTVTSTQPSTLTITANPATVVVNTPTYVTFTVASNGRPVSGAVVGVTGAGTGTGTTDINGQVTILINSALGTLTVTASKTGYTSGTSTLTATQPVTLTIAANPANVMVNNPTYVTFTVTGNGQPVSGAIVDITGAATGSGSTDVNGQVTLLVNPAFGTVTATASKTSYISGTLTLTTTAPVTLTITANPSNVTVNNPTYVTFTVTSNSQPVSGAIVDITGAATGSGTTNTNGQITILINAAMGTVTATSSKTGYISGTLTLTATQPVTLTITANPSNVTVNNPTYVTFTVTSNTQPVSGAVVDITGAATGHGNTNTNGQVTILVNPAYGIITATASKTGYVSGTTTLSPTIGEGQQLHIEASPSNVTANSPAYITFTVHANGIPVSNAIVFLTDAAAGIGTTDSGGNVRILVNAAFGTITATTSKTGYSSGTMTIPVYHGAAVTPATPPGVTVTPPTGTITPTPQPIVTVTPTSNGTVARNMPASIPADLMLTITLVPAPASVFDAPGYQVTETLPQGFVYINTTAVGVHTRDNVLTFTQIGSSSITYNVMSPPSNGSYTFSGIFRDEENNVGNVQGTSTITVGAGTGGTARYDANGNGRIERNEAVQAVMDFFVGVITRQNAIEVVMAFFSG